MILCLLLLFLPNLEAIDPTHSGFEDTVCCKMLDWTAQARHDPNILGPLAFTNLSKVTLQGSKPEEGGSYSGEHCQILTPFAALPSVRTMCTTFVYGGGWLRQFFWPYKPHLSNMTMLNLQASCLGLESLSQILGAIKCLKSFTYDIRPLNADNWEGSPMRMVIGMLLSHARTSINYVSFPCQYG